MDRGGLGDQLGDQDRLVHCSTRLGSGKEEAAGCTEHQVGQQS